MLDDSTLAVRLKSDAVGRLRLLTNLSDSRKARRVFRGMMTVGKLTESCWVIDLSKLRILVDTNVLLDLVSKDRPAHERVVQAVRNVIAASGEMLVATSSLKDVYCIYARHYGCESAAHEAVSYLEDVFDLRSLDRSTSERPFFHPNPTSRMDSARHCRG